MKHLITILCVVIYVFSCNSSLFAGNPDQVPSLTLDFIGSSLSGGISYTDDDNVSHTLNNLNGNDYGIEGLFKAPIASRITLRAGFRYLSEDIDNRIIDTDFMTTQNLDAWRFRVGFTIYFSDYK